MAPTIPELEFIYRRDNSTECNDEGCAAMPVSNWQKTGIPLIIGLVLFFIVFIVLFYIVRRRRKQNKAQEEARDKRIDMEDMEDSEIQKVQAAQLKAQNGSTVISEHEQQVYGGKSNEKKIKKGKKGESREVNDDDFI